MHITRYGIFLRTIRHLTGKDWIELVARILNKKPSYTVLPSWMVSFTGLFVPLFKELSEMIYQYEQDYVFNSSKFEKRFGLCACKTGRRNCPAYILAQAIHQQ